MMKRDENKIPWRIKIVKELVPSTYNKYRHSHISISTVMHEKRRNNQ